MLAIALVAAVALAPTSLTVTAWPEGQRAGHGRTWTLTCGPVGGTHPQRARACRQLAAVPAPFAPAPEDVVCTEIFGGPQEALVRGRFRGRRVWVRFSREDGCQIARWDRIRAVFPIPVGDR